MRHHEPVTIADAKARRRAAVREARAARASADHAAASDAIATHALALLPDAPARMSAYLSLPSEPGTDPLLARAHAAGHRVWVPRITATDLAWVQAAPGTQLTRGPLGIREPVGPAMGEPGLAGLDLLLLPGLAVDRSGHRLGQGGGFYDRALSRVPSHADGGPLRAILLFDEEVLDEVPYDAHDCRVDVAVTPSGVTHLGS